MSKSRDRAFVQSDDDFGGRSSSSSIGKEVSMSKPSKEEDIVVIEGWRASSIVARGGGSGGEKNRERTRFSMVFRCRRVGATGFYVGGGLRRVEQERTFEHFRAGDDGEHWAWIRFARVRGRFENELNVEISPDGTFQLELKGEGCDFYREMSRTP